MVDNNVEEKHDAITKRLDVIISLMMEQQSTEAPLTLKDKIKKLQDCGLDYKTIATILNKSPGHISKELSLLKKSSKEGA